jgi:hypothetical protein
MAVGEERTTVGAAVVEVGVVVRVPAVCGLDINILLTSFDPCMNENENLPLLAVLLLQLSCW